MANKQEKSAIENLAKQFNKDCDVDTREITVGDKTTQTPSEEKPGTKNPEQKPSTEGTITDENLPEAYPQTGIMQYAIVAIAIIGLISIYVALIKSKKDLR